MFLVFFFRFNFWGRRTSPWVIKTPNCRFVALIARPRNEKSDECMHACLQGVDVCLNNKPTVQKFGLTYLMHMAPFGGLYNSGHFHSRPQMFGLFLPFTEPWLDSYDLGQQKSPSAKKINWRILFAVGAAAAAAAVWSGVLEVYVSWMCLRRGQGHGRFFRPWLCLASCRMYFCPSYSYLLHNQIRRFLTSFKNQKY